SPLLEAAGDLKVGPDGNYILGTGMDGARVFSPAGTFVQQYGSGDSRAVTIVPGGKLWVGGPSKTVNVFDLDSGAQTGSFTVDHQAMVQSMRYSADTNTVLMADYDIGSIYERDLSGGLIFRFEPRLPSPTRF